MAKRKKKLKATVKKVITPAGGGPEKAQIDVHEADTLYREIRVENTLDTDNGGKSKLHEGEAVDVVIETESDANRK